ncbi:MAG: DNA polymerase III subunit beta [Deltaproteobacteria bacterium]|nr:DNA polymerase III subunit beta [Deltaproteobacteria bacterium]
MPLVLNIAREDFLSALSSMQSVTGKSGTIAILANILLRSQNDLLELTGTDLEIGIRKTMPAEILSQGSITLPAKKLFEIVRESTSDHIHIEERDNYWVKIKADSSDYNLAGMASEDFPSFPEYKEESLIEVEAEDLKDIIEKTIFSVAPDNESNFTLTGVLIEKETKDDKNYIRMVSSDGHRLSLMKKEVNGDISKFNIDKTTIIPRKGVQEIKKFCENYKNILVGFEEKQAVIKNDHSILIIRLMNGDFPDFRNLLQVINKEKFIEIKRTVLLNSMKRMNIFTEDRFNVVKCYIENNEMTLSSQSMDLGNAKEIHPVIYQQEPIKLGFNGKYFIDTLQVMTSETVKIFISGKDRPCLIYSENEPNFISVIMPMEI